MGHLAGLPLPCVPAGHAETGARACAIAPRPQNAGMEPLRISLGGLEGGVFLEPAEAWPEEYWAEIEQKTSEKARSAFRRTGGRSRSPAPELVQAELLPPSVPRGRSRRTRARGWTT